MAKFNCTMDVTNFMVDDNAWKGAQNKCFVPPFSCTISLQLYMPVLQDNLHKNASSGFSEIQKCRSGVKPGECYRM